MTNENFQVIQVAAGLFAGLRPEPFLTVSDWADAHRRLSSKSSAEPGQWRTTRTPYLREPMDMLSANNPVQEVIFAKAAQIGATEAGNNWIGYIIDNAPAPILMVMPTDETVKTNSKIRIDPMIEATPRLRAKIPPARSRDSGNTTFSKDFPGGILMMRGANSAVGLRSMPVRYLFLDEIDGYPADLDGEGSPISLAEARTRTFSRRKVFKISTPTIEGASAIQAEFDTTDQRYYFVPCALCGVFQVLTFDGLIWEPGKPETCRYKCSDCGELLPERFKHRMLNEGVWQATKPENANPIRVGYHLSSIYSPWQTWAEIATMWEKAQGNNEKLKGFINTVLGETWKAQGEAPDWQRLYDRREEYGTDEPGADNPDLVHAQEIPAHVGFITAGVDVQKNRLECEVVGWAANYETYSLGYHVLMGDTTKPEVWAALAQIIAHKWQRADGVEMPLAMTAIDSGYNTQDVYKFVRKYPANRVAAVKGNEALRVSVSSPRATQTKLDGKRAGWSRLWQVGVSILKSELYGWLKATRNEDNSLPPGYCHFPADYDAHYFKMLTAEQLQESKNKRGFAQFAWVKKYERNEALDCRVYARAAATMLGIDRLRAKDWAKLAPNALPVALAPVAPAVVGEVVNADEAEPIVAPVPVSSPATVPVKPRPAPAPPQKKRGGFWKR